MMEKEEDMIQKTAALATGFGAARETEEGQYSAFTIEDLSHRN